MVKVTTKTAGATAITVDNVENGSHFALFANGNKPRYEQLLLHRVNGSIYLPS